MVNGVHKNTPHQYQPVEGLLDIIAEKSEIIRILRNNKANLTRKLATKATATDDLKKLVMAAAHSGVDRVDALMRVGLKNGMSARAMLGLVGKAATNLYKPKGFTAEELARSVLLLKVAGPRAVEILQRSTGAPSLSTTRRVALSCPFQVSAGVPTKEEICENVSNTLGHGKRWALTEELKGSAPDPFADVSGYVLMFDEIKTEGRLRWDDRTNKIVGVAREDAAKVSLEFSAMEELDRICDAVIKGDVRLATEATVAAIGLLTGNSRTYGAYPVMVSGTCKTEPAEPHAKLIQTVIDACHSATEPTPGRLYCLASDGEARRGAALAKLTQKRPLSPSSRIHKYLETLRLLDLLIGDDDVTCDKDYKHIFKRLRNLLLRAMGIMVFGTHITTEVLGWHLRSEGVSPNKVKNLLNPNDKQDVVLAYNLLKAIWELPEAREGAHPAFAATRRHIRVLGRLFYHLVSPYLAIDFSLRDQLYHLSAAAHLLTCLYLHPSGGNKFCPRVLYADIQIMIKNVYFCIAKAKCDRLSGNFYIIHLGTDRLETSFGLCRSMIGNDSNVDLVQFGHRVANIMEANHIYRAYPDWDHTPRRLTLPPLQDKTELSAKADHVNPASWRGDVNVGNVSLATPW
ncbi:hypothetical protein CONPUDRAFT_60510, partial [Coniophora puteana RWD-64-598 SS2]